MMLVVFRSRLRDGVAGEFDEVAREMAEIARSMPGFISYTDFVAEDGERVSIHEWESAEHLRAWREHPRHREVQKMGRERFYREYSLFAFEGPRESRFTA